MYMRLFPFICGKAKKLQRIFVCEGQGADGNCAVGVEMVRTRSMDTCLNLWIVRTNYLLIIINVLIIQKVS